MHELGLIWLKPEFHVSRYTKKGLVCLINKQDMRFVTYSLLRKTGTFTFHFKSTVKNVFTSSRSLQLNTLYNNGYQLN